MNQVCHYLHQRGIPEFHGWILYMPSKISPICQSNFYALGVIVIFDAYYLHLSDNLDLVLEASSLCEA